MPLKANKDTYAFERVGPDAFVRREIKAGHQVPDGFYADEEGNELFSDGEPLTNESMVGFGAAPSNYRHQLAQPTGGGVTEEHQEDIDDEERAARAGRIVNKQVRLDDEPTPNTVDQPKTAKRTSGDK
jgi:hypothetical protein